MIEIIITIVTVLLSVAFFTIAERKVLASIQRRRGPNVVGFWGILQAFADGLKLLLKETIIPTRAS
jgi:NADH-ubiquinone oxidoreductase chain 1